jgi:DNA polymerase (family 10)
MNNYEIADQFSLLSKLMDIHGENSFKSKSYSSTAFNIERLPAEIAGMSDAELFGVRGIGEATGKKIRVLQETGKLPQLEELLLKTPAGILDMLQIKGLGPKKISVIWTELGIESLGELEYACNENRLVALKGFGAKTQESVLQNIAYYKQNLGFHLWAEVEAVAASVVKQLQAGYREAKFEVTGDVRRQNETVEFVEFVTTTTAETLKQEFHKTPEAIVEEADGVVLVQIPAMPKLRFYVTTADEFAGKLFATSCSEEFLTAFNERFTMPAHAAAEEEIFAANKLPFIPAMVRETAGILNSAAENKLPQLIQPSDIRGIIHSHSTWSDGVHTIQQMAEAAKAQGLEYLVISDHSQTAFYAGGLKPEQIAAQHQEVDALNERLAPFRIFKSIESDILSDGSLDYSDQVLATFDLVIASVHSNLKMSEEKAMERVLRAVRNPYTRILGHPTGRLLLSRKGYPLDHRKVIDVCAEHGVVVEINAHPRRLDLDWRWIEYALKKGVLLSVDPDAHAIEGYHDTYYGVMAAQKGGLTKERNLSSFSLAEFEGFLRAR